MQADPHPGFDREQRAECTSFITYFTREKKGTSSRAVRTAAGRVQDSLRSMNKRTSLLISCIHSLSCQVWRRQGKEMYILWQGTLGRNQPRPPLAGTAGRPKMARRGRKLK